MFFGSGLMIQMGETKTSIFAGFDRLVPGGFCVKDRIKSSLL